MDTKSGDEISFPVSKTPQLESKLLELPVQICELEISLINTRTIQMKDFIEAETIKNKILSEVAANTELTNEIKRKSAISEKLEASAKYQDIMLHYQEAEKILKLGDVELRYLNNCFTAYKSIARMLSE